MNKFLDRVVYDYPFLFVFIFLFFISVFHNIYAYFVSFFIFAVAVYFDRRLFSVFALFFALFVVFNMHKKPISCKSFGKGVVKNVTVGRNLNIELGTGKCKLYLFAPIRYSNVKIGDIIRFRAKLKTINELKNKGFAHYLKSKSIYYYGFVKDLVVVGKKQPLSFFESIRRKIENEFYYFLPQNVEYFLDSAILGDGRYKAKIKNEFINTQTAHIMAVSGLHMGFVFGLFYLLFYYLYSFIGYIYRRYNLKVLASISAFFPTLLYFFITGFHIPTIRSFIMTLLFVFSLIFSRERSSYNVLFFLAAIFLCLNRLIIFNPSFAMSFLMTFFALLIWSRVGIFFNNGYLKTVLFTFLMSVSAMPMSSYYFSKIGYLSFLANMIVIPFFGFLVVPLAFLGILVTPLPYGLVKIYIYKLVAFVTGMLLKIVEFMSSISHPINFKMPFVLVATIYVIFVTFLLMSDRLLHHQDSQYRTRQKISF